MQVRMNEYRRLSRTNNHSPRYARHVYTAQDTASSEMRTYECDLCSTTYRSEDELSSHAVAKH